MKSSFPDHIRKLMALCFLPAQHITPIFNRLAGEAATEPLSALVTYMRSTWITNRLWSPRDWSVYGQSIRTNNDCEGWHNRLNARSRPNMPFYLLISLLHDEASLLPVQVRLVSEHKLRRHQRKKYKRLQGNIFTYWHQYADGTRSAEQLLRACSRVYAPSN